MHGFAYKYPPESTPTDQPPCPTRTPLAASSLSSSSVGAPEGTEVGSRHVGIDQQASVVNGKLVVLREEEQALGSDNRQLMRLLRENGFSYKQYILGNKTKILEQIRLSE